MKQILPFSFLALTLIGCSSKGKNYKASDFGSEWPFKVGNVNVYCNGGAVYVFADGHEYPVNGIAKSNFKQRGIHDASPRPILLPMMEDSSITMSIPDIMIEEAKKNCTD